MKRILVVDDNEDTRRLLHIALSAEGFEVVTAIDGDEALRVQGSTPADVLVTDIFMPNRDGLETIAVWKTLHPACKIVVMSGGSRTGADYLDIAREIGADECLAKPFGIREFV